VLSVFAALATALEMAGLLQPVSPLFSARAAGLPSGGGDFNCFTNFPLYRMKYGHPTTTFLLKHKALYPKITHER